MEEWVVNTFIRGLALGPPLLWAALGEIYAERSGVVNLGVEGMMILGAFSAFALAQTTANPLLGLLIAAGAGAGAALLHALVTITLRANQYVSGLALTMLGPGRWAVPGGGCRCWTRCPRCRPSPPPACCWRCCCGSFSTTRGGGSSSGPPGRRRRRWTPWA